MPFLLLVEVLESRRHSNSSIREEAGYFCSLTLSDASTS